jgi:hypothetical protein
VRVVIIWHGCTPHRGEDHSLLLLPLPCRACSTRMLRSCTPHNSNDQLPLLLLLLLRLSIPAGCFYEDVARLYTA